MTDNDRTSRQGTRPRIGIDAHAIGELATGNERFISNVVREMHALCDHEMVLFFTSAAAATAWPTDERSRVRVIRPANPLVRVAILMGRAARRERLDVMLVQYTAPRSPGCPVVSVVHDVSFAEHPEWFSRLERVWMPRTIPATIRRASKIVTVSEFSKSEIQRIYGTAADKISVAYDGVDPVFSRAHEPLETPPYFLYVGNLEPRKNLGVLLSAFGDMRSRYPQVRERLLIAGRARRGGVAQRSDEAVRFLGRVDDEELAGLMQHATALCYPSLYEGFGLPPIEAMAAGTPALVSDIPVMQETTGDAAVLLPPTDARAWADAMAKVAMEPAYRDSLGAQSKKRAAGFTWAKTARVVLDALEVAASGRSG